LGVSEEAWNSSPLTVLMLHEEGGLDYIADMAVIEENPETKENGLAHLAITLT
jgi:hypothetical protein